MEDETTSGKITSSTYDREKQITYRKNEKNETVIIDYYYQQSGSFGINSNDEITFIVDKDYHMWPNGQLISYTNEAGVVTKNEFDIFERFCGAGLPISTTVSDANGTVYEYVSYEYDSNDNLILVKNWLEKPETGTGKYKATRYIYDEDGVYLLKKAEYLPILSSNQSVPELTSNNADDFAITSYEYDENHSIKGLVKKIVYPQQYTGAETDKGWVYEYDSNGNCISVTNPESTSDNQIKETYEYNDFGKVSKYTSGEGNVVRYE